MNERNGRVPSFDWQVFVIFAVKWLYREATQYILEFFLFSFVGLQAFFPVAHLLFSHPALISLFA